MNFYFNLWCDFGLINLASIVKSVIINLIYLMISNISLQNKKYKWENFCQI